LAFPSWFSFSWSLTLPLFSALLFDHIFQPVPPLCVNVIVLWFPWERAYPLSRGNDSPFLASSAPESPPFFLFLLFPSFGKSPEYSVLLDHSCQVHFFQAPRYPRGPASFTALVPAPFIYLSPQRPSGRSKPLQETGKGFFRRFTTVPQLRYLVCTLPPSKPGNTHAPSPCSFFLLRLFFPLLMLFTRIPC